MKNILFITMLLGVEYSQSAHLEIQNVNLTAGTLDVYMTNDVPVTGFQFQLSGLTVVSATGGEIVPDDWLVLGSGGENFIYIYKLKKGISSIRGGVKVLHDLGYPAEIIKGTKEVIESLNI